MAVVARQVGTVPDGRAVLEFTIRNARGTQVRVINYGATVTHWLVRDRHGEERDIVLGRDTFEGYLDEDYRTENPYFGCVIGRYANRIGQGHYTLDDREHSLPQNNGPNCLHGGAVGFDKVLWSAAPAPGVPGTVVMSHVAPHMDQGFGGELATLVKYTLTDDDALEVSYVASVNGQPTHVNLTQHTYFNLNGLKAAPHHAGVLDAVAQISSSQYLEVDDHTLPTGALLDVAGSTFDLRQPRTILPPEHDAATFAGYDHAFVLDQALPYAARVYSPESGICLTLTTTAPSVQFYTAGFLSGRLRAKTTQNPELSCGRFAGFCLEAQDYPDAPNKPHFPSTVLRPGEQYSQKTTYTVSLV